MSRTPRLPSRLPAPSRRQKIALFAGVCVAVVRHRNPQMSWTRNDIRDMHALSVAVVHCDVVVTERHVTSLLR